MLPRLYEPATPAATAAISLHFAAGSSILVLGFIQLITVIRVRYPALHRWSGRVYVSVALLAGIGGLTFIAVKGTVGGTVMDIGFSLYGVLMVACAVQTYYCARVRRLEAHRVWGLRLFALAIGSWLYRMDYGFWLLLTDGAGHTNDFRDPFDMLMAFFFYVPNLLVAETCIRAPHQCATGATLSRSRRTHRSNRLSTTRHLLFHGVLVGSSAQQAFGGTLVPRDLARAERFVRFVAVMHRCPL